MDLVIERDVLDIRRVRQRDVLPRLFRRLVSRTGQVVNVAHAARAEQILPTAAHDYAQLLEAVFLLHRLPAWGTTLSNSQDLWMKIFYAASG